MFLEGVLLSVLVESEVKKSHSYIQQGEARVGTRILQDLMAQVQQRESYQKDSVLASERAL